MSLSEPPAPLPRVPPPPLEHPRTSGPRSPPSPPPPTASRPLRDTPHIDPHDASVDHVYLLCDLGIHRVSMGVQDFDKVVQGITQRDQTVEETQQIVERCRARRVDGLNIDLMYGLPGQSLEGFAKTLQT